MPLVRKAGRGLAPTAAGEVLLAYARRLHDLQAEALAAVRAADAAVLVRVGVQEDFGDTLRPGWETGAWRSDVRFHQGPTLDCKV